MMVGHEVDINDLEENNSNENISSERPVQHVLVIGFHHKKGCQVEFAYPPLIPGGDSISPDLPSQWRNLPSLALPDGSHNFSSDTVYFHLPALHNPRQSVFGISCYRQIDTDKVVNKTDDITRGTVQKSVCVISRLPLYGQIQVKMSLITHAYFEGGDFSATDLIKQTYDNLNNCLSDDMLHSQQLYVGLSARDFVLHFKQKALQLFKLVLLERKVLFFKSPVRELSSHILTLLSLFPGLLESGLSESACIVPLDTPPGPSPSHSLTLTKDLPDRESDDRRSVSSVSSQPSSYIPNSESLTNLSSKLKGAIGYISGSKASSNNDLNKAATEQAEEAVPEDFKAEDVPDFSKAASCSLQELGLPLKIFTAGNLCHPYLSLPYLDILVQDSIHGYIIGATNALFKAKKGLNDVIIDIDEDKLDILDMDLRRDLSLTTEDLRFIDGIVRVVANEGDSADTFLNGVGWEGGDEWIRSQFRFYLTCLLRSSLEEPGVPSHDHFNRDFMTSFQRTRHYTHWSAKPALCDLAAGHPCGAGQLSMADMKLRLSHNLNNTEGGKKVTAAVQSTGRVVADTGKAVTAGLGAAKGALSSWWGGLRQEKSKSPSPGPNVGEVPTNCPSGAGEVPPNSTSSVVEGPTNSTPGAGERLSSVEGQLSSTPGSKEGMTSTMLSSKDGQPSSGISPVDEVAVEVGTAEDVPGGQ